MNGRNSRIIFIKYDVLENIRREVTNTISKNFQPNGFKMKTMSKETRDSVQAVINEFDRISI